MEWINPHVWIHMDVKSADGAMVSWMVEGGPPNALLRREPSRGGRSSVQGRRGPPKRRRTSPSWTERSCSPGLQGRGRLTGNKPRGAVESLDLNQPAPILDED